MGSKADKGKVMEWLNTDDFIACCDFACINHENLQKYFQEIILCNGITKIELGDQLKRFIRRTPMVVPLTI